MRLLTIEDAPPVGNGAKPRKADDAYEVLKDLIITMQLPPGAPLDERTLIARLDIGRTPLREAIQRLSHEQLVVSLPRRGYYVSQLSITEFQQMTTAREVIEPRVARMAAAVITADEIGKLRAIVEATVAEFDALGQAEILHRDLEFHRIVAEASRNRYLAAMVNELNTLMLRYWYISLTRASNFKEDFAKHHTLTDLLEAHDECGVFAEACEHVARFRRRMSEAIAMGDPLTVL